MGAVKSKQAVTNIPSSLPPEVLGRIFRLLPRRDLKMAVLVCRLWREVVEEQRLWACHTLRVTERNLTRIVKVLGSRRVPAVRRLEVGPGAVSQKLLPAVVRHQGLREVVFCPFSCPPVCAMFPRIVRAVSELEISKSLAITRPIEGRGWHKTALATYRYGFKTYNIGSNLTTLMMVGQELYLVRTNNGLDGCWTAGGGLDGEGTGGGLNCVGGLGYQSAIKLTQGQKHMKAILKDISDRDSQMARALDFFCVQDFDRIL